MQWSYDISKDGKQRSFHGNPLITDEFILIGTDYACDPEGIGHVYAFEKNTGKVRWKFKTTSVPTDIVRIGENVYFGSFQDNWYALKLRTGELLWKFSTGASNEGCKFVKSPVADESHLYLAGLDEIVYSLDAASGRVVWKRKLSAPHSTALAIKDNALFIGAGNNHIYRFNSETGAPLAELPVPAMPVGRLTLTSDALLMFLENSAERYGYIVSVTSDLTKLRWQQKFSPEWASERPHVWGESIVAGNCRGEVAAFRVPDGAAQWRLNLKGCIRSIASSKNRMFVGVQEGTVYAYESRPDK